VSERIVRNTHHHANPPNAVGLLRARRERPHGRRTADKRDELAAFHSSNSSARMS
jgi:hypothetical protein